MIDASMIEQLVGLRLPLGNQLALAPFSIVSMLSQQDPALTGICNLFK